MGKVLISVFSLKMRRESCILRVYAMLMPGKAIPSQIKLTLIILSHGKPASCMRCLLLQFSKGLKGNQLESVSSRFTERPCIKTKGVESSKKTANTDLWPPHMCAHKCTYTNKHEHVYKRKYMMFPAWIYFRYL